MSITQFCFSFRGRINRAQYWGYCIAMFVIVLLLGFIGIEIQDTINSSPGKPSMFLVITYGILIPVIFLLTIYTDIAVSIKRLHDAGTSGWYLLATIIPIIGALVIFLVCGFIKGNEGNNKYGPPPTPSVKPFQED